MGLAQWIDVVARTNIDLFIGLLNDVDLAPGRRAVITKLLIEEEDKLGCDLELLQFAETRAANGRERLNRLREKLDSREIAEPARALAERQVANFEAIQGILDSFCHQLRQKVNSRCV